MISDVSTEIGTKLTAFVSDVTAALTANVPLVLGLTFGLIGIFFVIGVVKKLAKGR